MDSTSCPLIPANSSDLFITLRYFSIKTPFRCKYNRLYSYIVIEFNGGIKEVDLMRRKDREMSARFALAVEINAGIR